MEQTQYPAYHSLLLTSVFSVFYAPILALATFAANDREGYG